MQLKKSALVCAAAFAAMAAGSAYAAMPTGADKTLVDAANAGGRVIFISGASAVQSGFSSIINTMFTGTPVKFANTTASSKDYEAAAGTLAAGTGDWAGQTAIIIYRVKGGSVMGVDPVARNTTIESLAVDSTNCSGTASPYTCALDTTGRKPDAGVSDVAPKLFKKPYNTEGEVAAESLSATELAEFTSAKKGSQTAIYGLAFGVPTTNNVADVKMTRSTVSAIMTGNVGTWDQVDSTKSGEIVICRRVPGSGTQAVMNLWAGNFPCGEFNVPADRGASGAWDNASNTFTAANGAGGLIVIENSTSGDVRLCLDAAETGGTYATKDRNGVAVNVDFGGTSYGAIGVLSMDSLSSSKTSGKWAFRALDGVGAYYWDNTGAAVSTSGSGKLPTKEVYENGDWDLQGWISFNIPGRTSATNGGAVGKAKREVLEKFLSSAKNPTVLSGITALKNVAMAIPGGSYTGDQVLDAEYLNGNQCAPYSRNYND